MVSASPPPAPPARRVGGEGRCSVGACAMRPREGAGEAVGRDLKRRGREKKGIRRGVELASTVAGEGRAGPEAAGW